MNRTSYEESEMWAPWVTVVLGVCLLAAGFGLTQGRPGEATLVLAFIFPVFVLLAVLFGRLRVRVQQDALVVGFGYVDVIKKRVVYDDVQSIEPVRYSPLGEFGGWGIKWGRGDKIAWTIRGNQALVMHLKNGKHLYVGSPTPARLAERVYQAAGDKLATGKSRDW